MAKETAAAAPDPKAEQLAALEHELEGYEAKGNTDRAKQVEVEIKRLKSEKPAKKSAEKTEE